MSDIVVHCAPPFGYSFGVVDRGVRMFDPTSLRLTGWWRANFPGTNWPARASQGLSSGRDLVAPAGPYNPPNIGTNVVNGYTPAKFSSATLTELVGASLGTFINGAQYSGWALIYVYSLTTDDTATLYLNEAICTETGSYWYIYLRSGGLVGMQHLDGGSVRQTVETPLFMRMWQLVQWRYDGTRIQIRVNDGAWVSTTTTALSGGSGNNLLVGCNYGQAIFINADLLDLAFIDSTLSDAQFDGVLAYCRTRYGLELKQRVFDPTVSLTLIDHWRGNYVVTTWPGTPGPGTSGTQALVADAGQEPDLGAQLNGYVPADFNGSSDIAYDLAGFGSGYSSLTTYFVWALVWIDTVTTTDTTHAYNNHAIFSDYSGAFSISLVNDAGTKKVQFYHYDGNERIIATPVSTGQWTLLQMRYDGTNVRCKVDNGVVQTTAASALSVVTASMQVGRSYDFSKFFDGKIMELGLMASKGGDALFDRIREYVNDRYKLSL